MADPLVDVIEDEPSEATPLIEGKSAVATGGGTETGESLEQYLREISRWQLLSPEGERAIAGARSQKRSALARLNPAQEPIPVRFLKFARHINRLTKSRYR